MHHTCDGFCDGNSMRYPLSFAFHKRDSLIMHIILLSCDWTKTHILPQALAQMALIFIGFE